MQGSKAEALAGTLQVMVGAETEPEPESPLARVLAALGSVEYFGKVGAASTVKLAINHLLIAETAAFSASLGLVRANGVDVSRFMVSLTFERPCLVQESLLLSYRLPPPSCSKRSLHGAIMKTWDTPGFADRLVLLSVPRRDRSVVWGRSALDLFGAFVLIGALTSI